MRKNLSVFGLVLAVVVTLGLSVATVGKAIADSCSACGCCNAIYWTSLPPSVDAPDGEFSFTMVLNWASDQTKELWSGSELFKFHGRHSFRQLHPRLLLCGCDLLLGSFDGFS